MKELKNYTVTAESVRSRDGGLAKLYNYLSMENHPNHVTTEKIYHIFGEDSFRNIVNDSFNYEAEEFRERQKEGKRGRYKMDSFAHSYALSIPKINDLNTHIRPSPEQWKLVFDDVAECIWETIDNAQLRERDPSQFGGYAEPNATVTFEINKKTYSTQANEEGRYLFEVDLPKGDHPFILNVEREEELRDVFKCKKEMRDAGKKYQDITKDDVKRALFANVHQQAEGNDHLNILAGKVMGGHIVKEVTQKAMLANIKATYTRSLFIHCNMNIKDYKPVRTGRPEKRVSVAQAKKFALKEALEGLEFEYLFKPMRNLLNNLESGRDKGILKWKRCVEDLIKENHETLNDDKKEHLEKVVTEVIAETNINEVLEECGFDGIETAFCSSDAASDDIAQTQARIEKSKKQKSVTTSRTENDKLYV